MNLMDKYRNKTKAGEQSTQGTVPDPIAPQKAPARLPYTIIYSRILDDFLLLVATDEDRDTLQAQGVVDTIYTYDEIKRVFPGSKVEE